MSNAYKWREAADQILLVAASIDLAGATLSLQSGEPHLLEASDGKRRPGVVTAHARWSHARSLMRDARNGQARLRRFGDATRERR